MALILFVVAPTNFQHYEYFIPKKILEQAGHQIETASLTTIATCDQDMKIETILLPQVEIAKYAAIVFVGGEGSHPTLTSNKWAQFLAAEAVKRGLLVAGICHGALILAKAGLLEDKEATTWPEAEQELEEDGALYVNFPVVAEGNIITAQGPEAANDFGKEIARKLQKLKLSFQLHDLGLHLFGKLASEALYHTSSKKFNIGDIIKPYWALSSGNLEVERLFEKIRKEKYPQAPSRFNVIFCWKSYDEATLDATRFLDSGRPRYLYQVEPLGQIYPCDVHAYNKAISAQQDQTYWAERYWQCADTSKKEWLVENGVKVTAIIDLF